MKTKVITILIIIINLFGYSQNISNDKLFLFSAEIGSDLNRGFEIKGEFDGAPDWYMGFFLEEFQADVKSYAYGFNIGLIKRFNSTNILGGARVGLIKTEISKPLYGLDLEVNNFLSENFYIGIKANLSLYNNIQRDNYKNEEVKVEQRFRPVFKFGIIF